MTSIQEQYLTEEEQSLLTSEIKHLDLLLSMTSKKELLFAIKTEIYKNILKKRPSMKLTAKLYERKEVYKALNESLTKIKKLPIFTRWMIRSIKTDLDQLYSAMESKNNSSKIRFKNKKRLLIPWVYSFAQNEVEDIRRNMKIISMDILRNLNTYFELLLKHSGRDVKSSSTNEMVFFHKKIIKVDDEVDKIDAIELLLSKIKNLKTPPLPNKNIWMPRDTPIEKISFPVHKPNTLYDVFSGEEPEPINDWNIELD